MIDNETPRERIVRSLKEDIEARERQLKKVERLPIEVLKERFPEGSWSASWGDTFEFCLPYSFALIPEVKSFMRNAAPEFELERENQYVWDRGEANPSAGFFLEYNTNEDTWRERIHFQIAFRTGREGTTCVLNQIGTKEVPVYEVTCAEGAAESISKGE